MQITPLDGNDRNHARVVLVIVGTLCTLALMFTLLVGILLLLERDLPTELWVAASAPVSGLLAMLVNTRSTPNPTPSQQVPVVPPSEPVPLPEVDPEVEGQESYGATEAGRSSPL